MSWKEKIKTYSKLRDEYEILELEQHRAFMAGEQQAEVLYEKIQEFKEKEYIAVEDTQEYVDALEIRLDAVQFCLDKATKSFESLRIDNDELKLKLQQVIDKYSFRTEYGVTLVSKTRIEELLRE